MCVSGWEYVCGGGECVGECGGVCGRVGGVCAHVLGVVRKTISLAPCTANHLLSLDKFY